MAVERFLLPGSERAPHAGARPAGTPNPSQFIEATIVLRRKAPLDVATQKQPVDRAAFAAQYGADPQDVERVEAFARQFDLHVVTIDLARRTVVVGGTIAAMNEAFGTSLALYQGEHGMYRGRTGPLHLPIDLQPAVVAVLGLDDRPQARTRCRRHLPIKSTAAAAISYTPPQIAALYQFPTEVTGAGETVAIIELGGGYRSADLTAYFERLGLKTPSVTAVSVDGGKNAPTGDPNGADGEVLLDVEVVGAIANGANIVVYFAPNTDQGFLNAISTAVHDDTHRPSIVSISWGGPESTWTPQALTSYDEAFQDAAALGVTVCCASGDSGSGDGVSDGNAHVDFPASSPHVLACGGTRIASTNGTLSSEVVWNGDTSGGATGGGISETFALPVFQQDADVPPSVNRSHFKGRGVPDVAGDADPASGYQVRVDGYDVVYGGTSAVAPLWAALVALVNERRGAPLGYVNPMLYPVGAQACRDITSGNNGAYSAAIGWDACTGLGSPNGATLAKLLGEVESSS